MPTPCSSLTLDGLSYDRLMILVPFNNFFSNPRNLSDNSNDPLSLLISLILCLSNPDDFQAAYDRMVQYFKDNRFRFTGHHYVFWGTYTRRIAADNEDGYFVLKVQKVCDRNAKSGEQKTFGLLFDLNVPYKLNLLPLMVELVRAADENPKTSVGKLELPGRLAGLTPDYDHCRRILDSYKEYWKLKIATIGESVRKSSWQQISQACLEKFHQQFLQGVTVRTQKFFKPPTNPAMT